MALCLIAVRHRLFLAKARRDPFLLAVILLVLISYNWADVPSESFQKVKSEFLPMVSFGLYLGTSFNIKNLFKKIGIAVTVGLLLSWLTAVGMPSIGKAQGKFAGAWIGVYGNKNASSSYMVLTALNLTLLSFQASCQKFLGIYENRWFLYLGLSATLFTFLTTSGTGVVLSAVIIFFIFLYSRFRWQGKVTVLLLDLTTLIVGSATIFLIANWDAILTGAGKDPTLTGRTVFWNIGIQSVVADRLWFGFGRGGFWNSSGPYVADISQAFGASIWGGGYIPAHGHNGFIELLLDIGLIGITLFAISFLMAWYKSLKQGYATKQPENFFPLGFMILFTINNFTESYTSHLSHIFWPLYIAIALNVGYPSLRSRKGLVNLSTSVDHQKLPHK